MNCTEQHEVWKKEVARVKELASRLGPQAEACVAQQVAYDQKMAEHLASLQAAKLCAEKINTYQANLAKYEEAQACRTVQDKYYAYRRLTNSLRNKHSAALREWEAQVRQIEAENAQIIAANAEAQKNYLAALEDWNKKNQLRRSWLFGTGSQKYSLKRQWEAQLKKYPFLDSYSWTRRTARCNTFMNCMSQAKKDSLQRECNPVRGLGETKPAPRICLERHYYPTCPSTCPPYYPPPGPQPTPPTPGKTKRPPEKPQEPIYPTWEAFSGGLPPGSWECDASAGKPSKPGCTVPASPPQPPQKPLCTVPEIPQTPPAPGCKPGFFEQVGPMWLLVAAGGAGLYWMARK
jgi:hypothetical protein